MTRFAKALCAIYGATALFLAWAAVQSGMANSPWIAVLFAAASIIPIIAWLREAEFVDKEAEALASSERAARVRENEERRAIREAADALQHVCCERWWTSLGVDHDPTCAKQRRSA